MIPQEGVLSVSAAIGVEFGRPIQTGMIEHDNTKHTPQAFC
jgi:hypothetical protein